jgi:hypothetical protein
MHSRADLVEELNRPAIYIQGLQSRFELPIFSGAQYSDAYLIFLRKLVYLRSLSISEESLRDLWRIEKKLLQLLHIDSTGSPTWFLDACSAKTNPQRRLLLTNYDLGVEVPTKTLQLGLNFADKMPEFFAGKEMGEDALRVLTDYLKLNARIRSEVAAELPLVRAAAQWGARLRT